MYPLATRTHVVRTEQEPCSSSLRRDRRALWWTARDSDGVDIFGNIDCFNQIAGLSTVLQAPSLCPVLLTTSRGCVHSSAHHVVCTSVDFIVLGHVGQRAPVTSCDDVSACVPSPDVFIVGSPEPRCPPPTTAALSSVQHRHPLTCSGAHRAAWVQKTLRRRRKECGNVPRLTVRHWHRHWWCRLSRACMRPLVLRPHRPPTSLEADSGLASMLGTEVTRVGTTTAQRRLRR